MSKCINLVLVCAILLLGARTVVADWDPCDPAKWVQLPDETPTGIDIRIDRNDGIQRTLADDFECTQTGPITDVHIWGSWNLDEKGQITKIHLSIHSDIPDPDGAGPGYSMPNEPPLWMMDFVPSQFTERLWKDIAPDYEWWWDVYSQYNPPINPNPQGDRQIWQYNIFIDPCEAFIQQGTTDNPVVYWLDVYVETDGQGEFGWKTSLQHWNDDAVYFNDGWQELHYPPEHPMYPNSVDMAFVITGEPCEPPEPNLTGYVKWEQLPDTSPNGIDIRCDRSDGVLRILADDFECNTPGPITDVHLWGSWKGDLKGQIQTIHLSIHGDVPDPDGQGSAYSMPDDPPLWEMDFSPADFNETLYFDISPAYEWWWDTYNQYLTSQGDHQIWQYDIFINPNVAFVQQGTVENPIVYWLDVYVELEPIIGTEFGWKTAKTHWNDDAVWGEDTGGGPPTWMELRYPPTHPQEPNSVDMAFAITTLDCFPNTDPQYSEWVSVGRPYCWCYPRQCHGNADGQKEGSAKLGYWYVGDPDLNIMIPAWKVKDPPKGPGLTGNDICADFARDKEGTTKLGYWRVGDNDLNIMIPYWKVKEVPDGNGVPPNCL